MITSASRLRIFAPDALEKAALGAVRERERGGEIPRPGFDFLTRSRGITEHFHIFYNPILGDAGSYHAEAVLAVCERDYNIIQGIFGGIIPARVPFNVIISPGIGGAYHHGCEGTDLYCTDSPNTDFINMLVVAEEVEVFSAAQGLGWDCATTNGEALSRVLAEVLYPSAAVPIAAKWLNTERPDYITMNEQSPLSDGDPADRDDVSNACGVLFLNWLHYLGYGWDSIVQAGASSLGQTYTKLTLGRTDAFKQFSSFIQALFPKGIPVPSSLPNNPFPRPEPGDIDVLCRGLLLSMLLGARF